MERACLQNLLSELLLLILVQATGNCDVPNLRLVNSGLNQIVVEHHRALFLGLCWTHSLPDTLLDAYFTHHAVKADGVEGLLFLSREVSTLETFCKDEQHLIGGDSGIQNRTLTHLLWFSTFTSALKAGVDLQQNPQDILAPSGTIDSAVPLAMTYSFKDWIKNSLSLTELEAIITAINIAASKLWASVFLYKVHSSRVNTFASLSGHTFNIEQAILTEHIIWHGPRWAGRLLTSPALGNTDSLEHRLHLFGPWFGSKEDGARIAANGLARFLWKERQRKVDEEREKKAQQSLQGQAVVATLSINPAVWRGSAGDM